MFPAKDLRRMQNVLCSFCVGDEPLSEMTTQLTSEAHNTAEKGIKSEGATCTTNDKQKEMSKQSNKMTERETMYMEEKISETAFVQSLDEYEQKKGSYEKLWIQKCHCYKFFFSYNYTYSTEISKY